MIARRLPRRALQLLRQSTIPQWRIIWAPKPQCLHPLLPYRSWTRNFTSRHDPTIANLTSGKGEEDTIYALSTPNGTSAIAIVRITGPRSLQIYHALTKSRTPPKPRYAHLHRIHHPTTSAVLDPGALCLFFPASTSLTGTDTLEIHLHGSRAIISAVLSSLPLLSARPADPGEFTKRAFDAGKLSLPEVEALGETLSAVTEQQRIRAVRGTSSHLSTRYESWRQELVAARGVLEALIDFADDQGFEETPAELVANTVHLARELHRKLQLYTENAVRGELLRSGISVCFLGAPNAGKSSLLNRIVGREAAIVSPEPGTTRDVVDLAVDIGGFMVLVGDTAGLRPVSTASGKVEIEGMRRARERVRAADIVVAVVDASRDIPPEDGDAVVDTLQLAESEGKRVVVVGNKIDLLSPASHTSSEIETTAGEVLSNLRSHLPTNRPIIPLSCLTGTGVPSLLSTLTDLCTELTSPLTTSPSSDSTPLVITPAEAESSLAATQRQKLLLSECQQHLEIFISMCEEHGSVDGDVEGEEVDIVLAAELLRDAAEALGKVVGRGEQGDVEEVLGVVFEKFCVGK